MKNRLTDYIVPDLTGKIQKNKIAKRLVVCGIILSVAVFGAGGYLITLGPYYIPVILIGIGGFVACGFAMMSIVAHSAFYFRLISVIELIKSKDKILLFQIQNCGFTSEAETELAVNRLIETKNLSGYRIIAGVMVASDDVYVSEDDAVNEYKLMRFGIDNGGSDGYSRVDVAAAECYYCRAKLNPEWDFCPKCGAKVNKGN